VLAALGLGLLWQEYQLTEELKRVVAAEDQAALAGDLATLTALTDPDDRLWFSGQPYGAGAFPLSRTAPRPHSFAWPLGRAGEVRAVERLDRDLMRVDVVRAYSAIERYGFPAETYVLPQFYRRRPDGWKRARPPASFWGAVQTRSGARLDWTYSAVDAELVAELASELETLTAEACAAFACPDEARFAIWLDPDGADDVGSPTSVMVSRLLGLRLSAERLRLPSPHAAGLPADDASRQAFQSATAVRLLSHILIQIGPTYGGARRNPFLFALAARTAAHLGVDLPAAAHSLVPEPALTAQAVWETRLSFQGTGYDFDRVYQPALILLNRVLRGRPAEAEARLFQALKTAADPAEWLAQGLALTTDEARARWAAAEAPLAVDVNVDAPEAYALQCDGQRLTLWSPGPAAPVAVLPDWVPAATPLAWSPDGQRLLIDVANQQQAVVDLASKRLLWLPGSTNWPRAQWLNATQLAYVAMPIINWALGLREAPSLVYFDTAHPDNARPTISGLGQYVRSPDGIWAVVSNSLDVSSRSWLGLIPAQGGSVRWLDWGGQPAWAPDSRALAYYSGAGSAALRVAEVAGGEPRLVLPAEALQALSPVPALPIDLVEPAWLPDGRLLFKATSYGNLGPAVWLGLVNADGSGLTPLWSHPAAAAGLAGFSADGRYLALVVYRGAAHHTLVLDLDTGATVRELSGFAPTWGGTLGQAAAWGLDGRQLQVNDGAHLFWIDVDALPAGQPQPAPLPCPVAVANPQP